MQTEIVAVNLEMKYREKTEVIQMGWVEEEDCSELHAS